MKEERTRSPWGGYPHVIEQKGRRNWRHSVLVANEPFSQSRILFEFTGPSAVDARGRLTGKGRELVLGGVVAKAVATNSRYCVVWSKNDCTFVMRDGGTVDGIHPPEGDPAEPEAYGLSASLVDCRYVELPARSNATHLCVRRLRSDLVEISSGAPIFLGYWDEPSLPGEPDPVGAHIDEHGAFHPPQRFRGADVTGVDGGRILGPIQPDGVSAFFVAPWPQDVFDACFKVAGRALPADLREAVWRAVDPNSDMMFAGPLLAA